MPTLQEDYNTGNQLMKFKTFTLEACDNDIVEALIYLEKKDKIRKTRHERAKYHESNFKSFFKEVMNIKFLIKKKSNIVMDLPLVIVALFAIVTLPLFLIFVGIAILTGHKFQIRKGAEVVKVKKVFDDLKDNIKDMTDDTDDTDTGSENTPSDHASSEEETPKTSESQEETHS